MKQKQLEMCRMDVSRLRYLVVLAKDLDAFDTGQFSFSLILGRYSGSAYLA